VLCAFSSSDAAVSVIGNQGRNYIDARGANCLRVLWAARKSWSYGLSSISMICLQNGRKKYQPRMHRKSLFWD